MVRGFNRERKVPTTEKMKEKEKRLYNNKGKQEPQTKVADKGKLMEIHTE